MNADDSADDDVFSVPDDDFVICQNAHVQRRLCCQVDF